MSQSTLVGFVLIDGEQVLTYEQLREIGFIGPSAEAEYLGGMHGINGLFQIRPTPVQDGILDDQGISIAKVETPYFADRRLAMEPEAEMQVDIEADLGEILCLAYYNGFTQIAVEIDSDNAVEVHGKLSASMYHTNAPQTSIDLKSALGWSSAMPAMPSPADVLAQLGSQKSLADQFAEAFSTAKPAPQPTFTEPKRSSPPPQVGYTPPPFTPPVPEPVRAAPVPQVAKPVQSPDELLNSMFGVLLG